MDSVRLRAARLVHHALVVPEAGLGAAARRLTATQAQEFWAGRWALGIRTAGEPTLTDVDRAFAAGGLVRAWTQRGTLHIVAAEDLGWICLLYTSDAADEL
ncbi:DNA glycosylase AlkZ-like family protein [uncultured Microbacterium sp.]|uniref:DNA glycosylase AlkZ-like family protein n=1 Tax=uncultured Microbacterium sp. TaxID=191216 RepID=UPI0025E8725B|nr:crosslink repair DNA glycosylase YcaQ family protein [uncultured Microbacterium sp.]